MEATPIRVHDAVLVLSLLVMAYAAAGCQTEQEAEAATAGPRPVHLHTVESAQDTTVVQYPGRVEARRSVGLAFRVGGPLTGLPIKEGDEVEEGQLLAQIDKRDYRLRVRALGAEVAAARAQRQQAARDRKRTERLVQENAAAGMQLDQVETGFKISAARTQGGFSHLQSARAALKDTALKAPFKGRVARLMVENHQTVGPGQPIVLLQDLSAFHMKINVPERDMPALLATESPDIRVSFEVSPDKAFKASVVEFGTAIDPQTQSYQVTLEIAAEPGMEVLPGMTATARWHRHSADSPLSIIPLSSVVTSPDGQARVWVVSQERTLSARQINIGAVRDGGVEVIGGLSSGEEILSKGVHFAQEGLPVLPVNGSKPSARR